MPNEERQYFVLRSDNCRFEGMTKEQILAAITQAVEGHEITDVDTGFVSVLKEQNKNTGLKFWIGTQAEYNAIAENNQIVPNTYYIITDDNTDAEITERLTDIIDGTIPVGEAQTALTVNGLSIERVNNVLRFGDYIIPHKKLIDSGSIYIPSRGNAILYHDNASLRGRTFEIIFDGTTHVKFTANDAGYFFYGANNQFAIVSSGSPTDESRSTYFDMNIIGIVAGQSPNPNNIYLNFMRITKPNFSDPLTVTYEEFPEPDPDSGDVREIPYVLYEVFE